jgi:L-aspartate oxidase
LESDPNFGVLELRNLVTVADLIVRSAQSRHESRGLHFSRDYPELAANSRPTTLAGQDG